MQPDDLPPIAEAIALAVKPLIARIAVLEAREVRDGKDGAPGKDGRDGIDGKDGRDGLDGKDGLPGRDGQDGAPGRDGTNGLDGQHGKDGRDGLDGKEGLPGRDGRDGLTGKPGENGKDGLNGKDGRDGLSLTDFKMRLDERGRQFMQLENADTIIETRIYNTPYQGIWKEGESYELNDTVTFGGSLYIARCATTQKPATGTDWQLCVRAGRDAKR